MPTTTPNFGWSVPVSTDLVKDGATAIELLGDSIDTSLVDLKGGTTGQVLAKASGTDMDFSWVTTDDADAIQNAIVDAKGDLIGATAADTPARLAVGANGTVLTADSTEATGLKWATPAVGGMTLLSTTTLSGSTTTISSISGSYTDLKIYIVEYLPSVDNGDCLLRLNSDTGSNYGSTVTLDSNSPSLTTSVKLNNGLDNVVNDNLFVVELPLYANANVWKQIRVNSTGVDSTAGTAIRNTNLFAGYKSTTAISSVTIFPSSGTMAGTVLIYGVN
jgi:hypothetical protein